jgi:hypothetical protein
VLSGGSFTSIPDFPGAVQTAPEGYSHIGGLNSQGDITSNHSSSSPFNNLGNANVAVGLHGFLLSAGVYTSIDFPGALATIAPGLNDYGAIVGAYEALDGTIHGFLRTP